MTTPNAPMAFQEDQMTIRKLRVEIERLQAAKKEALNIIADWFTGPNDSKPFPFGAIHKILSEQTATQVGTNWELNEQTKREIDEINKNSMRAAAMAKDVKFD